MELALIALVIFSGIATIIGIQWYCAEARREQASRFFLSRGCQFIPELRSADEAGCGRFRFFSLGRYPRVRNAGERSVRGHHLSIFDFRAIYSSGKSSRTVPFTVAQVRTTTALPVCTVQPETFLSKIAQVVGYEDIDFDHDPEFSKQFVVRGPEPSRITGMLTTELREFFKAYPDLSFESGPDGFIWYVNGLVKIEQYDGFLSRVEQLATLVERAV